MPDTPEYRFREHEWAHFRPDHKSFGHFIKSDQMRDVTAQVAQAIADLAQSTAPRSKRPGPHMADQFKVRKKAGFLKVGGNIRVNVEVYNSDVAAAPNEFGGKNNKRHRTLGRAGAALGIFKPSGGPK